ncbi:unnamed protein product [Dimorphilus gyrociliatus]|uniref:Fork-head domain-containing protein n=1 Tax=Dimorphilus gyrociliatus TaxID=2664684 RepID=A0A7I8VNL4_9ANNE|nr:unnamed protein product [Dimorphilus gyrociliatus]
MDNDSNTEIFRSDCMGDVTSTPRFPINYNDLNTYTPNSFTSDYFSFSSSSPYESPVDFPDIMDEIEREKSSSYQIVLELGRNISPLTNPDCEVLLEQYVRQTHESNDDFYVPIDENGSFVFPALMDALTDPAAENSVPLCVTPQEKMFKQPRLQDSKPPKARNRGGRSYTQIQLLAEAALRTEEALSLQQLFDAVVEMHPEVIERYQVPQKLRESLKHCLCTCKGFVKGERSGRGNLWTVHPAAKKLFKKGIFAKKAIDAAVFRY